MGGYVLMFVTINWIRVKLKFESPFRSTSLSKVCMYKEGMYVYKKKFSCKKQHLSRVVFKSTSSWVALDGYVSSHYIMYLDILHIEANFCLKSHLDF